MGRRDSSTVKEIMTARSARLAAPTTTVAEAATLMLDGDCGILPVRGHRRYSVGVVTRAATCPSRSQRGIGARPELTVTEVAQVFPVRMCDADDEIRSALQTMSRFRIRRLPVRGGGGAIVGVVSIDDILLNAGALKTLSYTRAAPHPAAHLFAASPAALRHKSLSRLTRQKSAPVTRA